MAELTIEQAEEEVICWTLFVDGSFNVKGSGAGVILQGPNGKVLEQSLHFDFPASNNQFKYEV